MYSALGLFERIVDNDVLNKLTFYIKLNFILFFNITVYA